MTINNREQLIRGALDKGDFAAETLVGNRDVLLERRSDGVFVWITQSRTHHDTPNYTIGMSAGSRDILKITLSKQPEESSYRVIKITVGMPAEHDWDPFFTYREYRVNNKWVMQTPSGYTTNIFSHDKKTEISQLEAMQKTRWFVAHKDLPPHVDLAMTTDRFLVNILGWIRDPLSFETADIKPIITPEGVLPDPGTDRHPVAR
jgi:hypothetical protein